ncbi:hypothetical protein ES703_125499 [subsurface metagenome]
MWQEIHRGAVIFDTSALPRPGIAQDAYVLLYGSNKYDSLDLEYFKVGLTAYDQDDNTQIVKADYGHYLPYEASKHKIPWENIIIDGWNRFDLTDFEIGAIRDHPIREYGIREMSYDFRNVEPPWKSSKTSYVSFASVENKINKPPELHVNWLPTGG